MRKIVVPTDFSENAMHAAAFAAGIAAINGATIYLFHAMDAATDPILEPIALDSEYLEKYTRKEFTRLRTTRQRIHGQNSNLPIELRVSKGMAADAILQFSQNEKADLVVMGVHGSGRLKELLIGSVTAAVIARSKIPVLSVPPESQFHAPAAILLATKKFDEEHTSLPILVDLARTFNAPVHVVSFLDDEDEKSADYLDTTWHLNHYLEFLQRRSPDLKFTTHLLEGKNLQASIDEYCRIHHIPLIAVFNHPRGLVDKLCGRNNTSRTVFHSSIPVLVLPCTD